MSHAIKPPAKIGTQGRNSRDASNSKNAWKAGTVGPPATACSKETAEMPTTPMVTPGMSAIAKRPAPGNHQEL
jgi:hypothetical protein